MRLAEAWFRMYNYSWLETRGGLCIYDVQKMRRKLHRSHRSDVQYVDLQTDSQRCTDVVQLKFGYAT